MKTTTKLMAETEIVSSDTLHGENNNSSVVQNPKVRHNDSNIASDVIRRVTTATTILMVGII